MPESFLNGKIFCNLEQGCQRQVNKKIEKGKFWPKQFQKRPNPEK
jgi:hypothetical protein